MAAKRGKLDIRTAAPAHPTIVAHPRKRSQMQPQEGLPRELSIHIQPSRLLSGSYDHAEDDEHVGEEVSTKITSQTSEITIQDISLTDDKFC